MIDSCTIPYEVHFFERNSGGGKLLFLYSRSALRGRGKIAKETGESVYEVLNRLVMESPTDGLTKDERKFGSKNGKLRLSIAQAEFSVAIFF